MARKSLLMMLCAALLLAASCNKTADKTKSADKGGKKTPAAAGSKQAAAPAPGKNGTPAAAGQTKSLQDILNSVPCKLESKPGMFALFPDNPVSGQWCFTLTPGDPARGIPSFDIQTDNFYIVLHDTAPRDAATVSVMRWADNGSGGPALGAATDVPVSRDTYPDAANPGWSWIVLTPQPPADLTSGNGGFYGLVVNESGEQTYLPMFK